MIIIKFRNADIISDLFQNLLTEHNSPSCPPPLTTLVFSSRLLLLSPDTSSYNNKDPVCKNIIRISPFAVHCIHLLIVDKDYYDTLTDESAYNCLKDCSLADSEFAELTSKLIELLEFNAN